jgi:hypothetical protein
MAESGSGCKTGCKYGCLGCLGLLVLVIGISAVVTGIAWSHAKNENVEQLELARDLAWVRAMEEADEMEAVPEDLSSIPPAGTVILDFNQTSKIDIRPGKPGEPAHVKATFDSNYYELSESYTDGDGESGWTYEVHFRRTSTSYWVSVLKEIMSGSRPRVFVYLPPDIPYDLEIDISQGGGEVELGGLWLTDLDVNFLQGGGAFDISKPLRTPIENLSVDFSQGGGALQNLGNASPRNLDISFSMGGGAIDLSGEWQRDAHISIAQSMGGVTVVLPDNVEIRGLDHGGLRSPGDVEVPLPVLTFETSSQFGELEFID